MNATETKNFSIPEGNLAELTEKLAKLNKKAAKLGLAPITLTVGTYEDKSFRLNDIGCLVAHPEGSTIIRFFNVEVTGALPRLAGYEFVATLQHLSLEDGTAVNMLRTVPSFEAALPEEFRSSSPERCDHCKKAIKTRKDTYIVRHTESGVFMQVGRTCTQDFLGGKDPHEVAAQLSYLFQALSMAGEFEEGFGGGYSGQTRTGTDTFLAAVATMVRTEGWLSKTAARERYDSTERATACRADSFLTPPRSAQAQADWRKWHSEVSITQADKDLAETARSYVLETLGAQAERSDYEHNLWVAVQQSSLEPRMLGIAASAINFYKKAVEQAAERAQTQVSNYIGTEGERLKGLVVTVLSLRVTEGFYGTTFIYKMADSQGNKLTWFASSNQNLTDGQEVMMDGTVKKHEEYKGTKGTVLTRCTVYTEEGRRLAEEKAAKAAAKAAKKASKGIIIG